MEKLIAFIKEHAPREIASAIGLQIIILCGILSVPRLEKVLSQEFSQKIYTKLPILTISSTVLVLYMALLGSYIYLYWKYRTKLIKKLGILWDREKEAHCPSCETLLSNYGAYTVSRNDTFCGFTCIKCNKPIYLTDKGLPINLEEAKNLIWGDNS